jgi:hypothetical protein
MEETLRERVARLQIARRRHAVVRMLYSFLLYFSIMRSALDAWEGPYREESRFGGGGRRTRRAAVG